MREEGEGKKVKEKKKRERDEVERERERKKKKRRERKKRDKGKLICRLINSASCLFACFLPLLVSLSQSYLFSVEQRSGELYVAFLWKKKTV